MATNETPSADRPSELNEDGTEAATAASAHADSAAVTASKRSLGSKPWAIAGIAAGGALVLGLTFAGGYAANALIDHRGGPGPSAEQRVGEGEHRPGAGEHREGEQHSSEHRDGMRGDGPRASARDGMRDGTGPRAQVPPHEHPMTDDPAGSMPSGPGTIEPAPAPSVSP